MSRAIGRVRSSLAVLAIVAVTSTCSTKGRDGVTATRQALTTENGLAQNGLTTNALWNNALWNNALWNNALWNNALWNNALWNNALWNNALWNNALWNNALWNNGVTGDAAVPGNTLRSSSYARQLLQYIYSCAMPATTSTTLDPNLDAPIPCTSDAACGTGYACVDNKCVIPLQGGGANGSGMGVNADGTTWWADGTCDESCQRWVSACVLARTNAYGVRVQISMRAPAVAPPERALQFAKIQAALETTPAERADYAHREGAYYGNIFATTPIDAATGLPAPYPGTDGPATGPIASTPVFYACAGPDSNTPQITKRFCSSRGDQSVINVPGNCVGSASDPPVCDGIDASGSIFGCFTSSDATLPRTHYDEVITVYLAKAIAACGNSVCESPEEDGQSCPSDCHPGGWARTVDLLITGSSTTAGSRYHSYFSVSPFDDTIVLVGDAPFNSVDIGGPVQGTGNAIVVKYTRDGGFVWATRFTVPGDRAIGTVTADGSVFVFGRFLAAGGGLVGLAKLTSDGQLVNGWPIVMGGTQASGSFQGSIKSDSAGNVFVTSDFSGTATFATIPTPTTLETTGNGDFVVKVLPDGTPAWAQQVSVGASPSPAIGPSGDYFVPSNGGVARLAASTGAPTTVNLPFFPVNAVEVDASGELYVTGNFATTVNLGAGCGAITSTTGSKEFYLAKYSPDGSQCRWVARATMTCPTGAIYCDKGLFEGGTLAFDRGGNIVVGGQLWPLKSASGPPSGPLVNGAGIGAVADFGAGPFPTFRFPSVFVASYAPAGGFLWAKQVPIVLFGDLRGIALDSENHILVAGTYAGSMQLDDRLLVNSLPEDIFGQSTYFGRFAAPSQDDDVAPAIGAGVTDEFGAPTTTVPRDIYLQATGPDGAKVFFMPPTAVDEGHAGVTVMCSPAPNTTFPIGTTVVTCTASDPLGNSSSATFTVTVADKVAPVFPPVVADVTQQATSAAGATVFYTNPTATDQVDGARSVTCAPASGSLFPVGTTTVACTAGDASNNQSQKTFNVIVTPAFGVTCTSTAGCGAGTCVDGVCCNTLAVTCGPCHACNVPGLAGQCAPTSGGACSDGNACTQIDTCQAGTCMGANPVTCNASDQCHVAGACDPSTGACSNPAAPNGTSCSDGNACTASDVCTAGACVGGAGVSCDDQNPCTVDSCDPIGGCVQTPGNAGAICRAAGNACDSAEICTGSSASCPVSSDKLPPTLAPGTNQTVVGNCSGSPVVFAVPPLASSSCESGTNVTCTWTSGSSHGTCGKSASGTSLPGNRYGAHTITCTAKDAGGNVSAPVVFTVTVLKPLTVRIQLPLKGDNNTVNNVVKLGSTVPNKVLLYACGTNVTKTVSVIAKLGTSYVSSGGSSIINTVAACNDTPDTSGVMKFDGTYYRYNLSTKGFSVTAGIPAFYQENITVAYKSAPSVVVGSDAIQIDTK